MAPADLIRVGVALITGGSLLVLLSSKGEIMKYAKFVVAALIAAATAAQSAITDDTITANEWVAIALAGLGAVAVFFVPNKTET